LRVFDFRFFSGTRFGILTIKEENANPHSISALRRSVRTREIDVEKVCCISMDVTSRTQ